ncbi:MAG: nucleotide sugar dehydrogenase [Deltaproteobacteria bacterium]|nr:nucleotide sugar dehydrogenase [Deltaproteobacteria bacterium]
MNIGFAGLGKLGLPVALAIEAKGHRVVGYDPADGPGEMLRTRRLRYREADADTLLQRSRIEMLPVEEVVRRSDLVFVTIQTPHEARFEGVTRLPDETRDFDYRHLCAGVAQLSEAIERLEKETILVVVSTVLPGTIRRDIKPLLGQHARLCYNPFFIAMGTAIRDFLNPEFVLFGVDDERSASVAEAFYRTIHNAPFRRTTLEEAEIIKVLYNTFVSTKIAFANTVMEICHHTPGADVDVVLGVLHEANERLVSAKYLAAGMGDGGACHPRDNIALSHLSARLGLSFDWFRCVMQQRERQTDWLADLIEQHRHGRDILVLGRSFKPESNIVTGSAAALLENILRERGLPVSVWDPHVNVGVQAPSGRPFCYFVGTKHPELRTFPFEPGSVVLDPWRFVSVPAEVELIPIGRGRPYTADT